MKYWYQKPNKQLKEFVRTVLIMEGFSKSDFNNLPVFTNGMPTLFCKTEKDKANYEKIIQLTLFSKSKTDIWN
jgi:hypothetical protein